MITLDHNMVGIDPSFTRTGITVLTKDKKIHFHTLSQTIGKKDFIHTYNSAYILAFFVLANKNTPAEAYFIIFL